MSWLRLRLVAAPDPAPLGRARGLALLLAGAGGLKRVGILATAHSIAFALLVIWLA